MVIGGWEDDDPRTLQIEGEVDFPVGEELERIKLAYYAAFPDGPGRLDWPELVYVRMTPRWARFADYLAEPPDIHEWSLSAGSLEGAGNPSGAGATSCF